MTEADEAVPREAVPRNTERERERASNTERLAAAARDEAETLRRDLDRAEERVDALEAQLAAAQRETAAWRDQVQSARDERDDANAGRKLWKDRHDEARTELRLAGAVVDAAEALVDAWDRKEPFAEKDGLALVAAVKALREVQSDDDD